MGQAVLFKSRHREWRTTHETGGIPMSTEMPLLAPLRLTSHRFAAGSGR